MATDPTDDPVPLRDRLRRHVRSRLDVEGQPYLQNGAWSMMLEAATALDHAYAEIERLKVDGEKLRDFIVRHAIAKEDVELLLQQADRLRAERNT